MDKKLILISIGLVLGTVINFYINTYFYFLLLIISGISLLINFDKKILYFSIGIMLVSISLIFNLEKTIFKPGDRIFIDGEVVKSYERYEKFQTIEIKTKDNKKFSLSTIGDEEYKLYDKVKGDIEIQDTNGNYNFNMYNLEKYKFLNSIDANGKGIYLKRTSTTSFIKTTKLNLINYVEKVLDKNLSPKNSGLVKKMVLANSNLDDSVKENFSQGGISHLLAISGLHIYIIIGVFEIIFKKLKLNYNISFFIIMLALGFYGFILDFPPSVVRATLMYFLLKLSEIFLLKVSKLSILLVAFIIQLTINPKLIFDLGFQLSYLSILGIIILKDKFFSDKNSYIKEGVALYLSVNIFILPILIYNFNNFNFLSLGINLFATPIITIVLILSYLGIIVNPIGPLTSVIFSFINFLLDGLNFYLQGILDSIDLSLRVLLPNLALVFIYYLLLLLILNSDYKKITYKYRKIFGALSVFFIINSVLLHLSSPLIVGFFDVGQGDSAYLIYKDKYIQIDTGGSSYLTYNPGEEVTAKAIKKRGIKIDLLVLSHFDNDHVLGTPKLIDNNLVKNILISKGDEESEVYKKIINSNVNLFYPPENKVLKVDKDLEIKFLNTEISNFTDSNDSSLVLLVKYKNKKILLTGDISSKVEEKISKDLGKIDILKVSHHGSDSSSNLDFLYSIRPDYSVISVGKNNTYGHPSKRVINNLNKIKSKILRTDELGEITFYIDRDIIYKGFRKTNLLPEEFISIILSVIIGILLSHYVIKEEEIYEI